MFLHRIKVFKIFSCGYGGYVLHRGAILHRRADVCIAARESESTAVRCSKGLDISLDNL